MNFQKYIDQSWAKHDKQTDEVVASYSEGQDLLRTEDEVLAFVRLISHVATEHNFKFDIAITTLERLKQQALAESTTVQTQINRQVALMKYILGKQVDISNFSNSDQTIIFISAAASFLFQKDFEKAEMLLNKSITQAQSLEESKDPAFRTLAMSTNNMASEISQRPVLNPEEKKLMIELAHHARNFWEKAGTWLQVERAEYYLSKYYRKSGDFRAAEQHGVYCLQICEKEKADPLEHFFAHEAIALAFREKNNDVQYQRHLEQMRSYFSQCKEADQAWMAESLKKAEG